MIPVSSSLESPVRINRLHARSAFTLMEMLIVLAIIALITGFVVNEFDGIVTGANEDVARAFVNGGIDAALLQFRMHTGSYPTTEEGIKALIQAPPGKGSKWRGPYIKGSDVPLDPWGNPYHYRYPGQHNTTSYDLWSSGGPGGGESSIIGNW